MPQLPWDLWLNAPALPEGLSLSHEYDAASGLLTVTLTNRGDAPVQVSDIRVTSELEIPAGDGWAWLQGRTPSSEARVCNFASGQSVPKSQRSATSESVTYRSEEQLAITLLAQSTPVLFVGSLAMSGHKLDIEVTLDADESRVTSLALVFNPADLTIAPGESANLQPILLTEGRDALNLMHAYADDVVGLAAALPAAAKAPATGPKAPFGPAIGRVETMPVAPSPVSLKSVASALHRNWMNGRWWRNNPGALNLAEPLPLPEARFLATAIAMSGGVVDVLSANDLPADRQEIAAALTSAPGIAALPYDLADGPTPFAWRVELGEGRFLVGFLNWGDTSRWIASGEFLRPGEIAFDVWNRKKLGMGDTLLRPHEGALWQVASRGPTPRVVGDTASLTYQDLFQRQVSGRIQVRNDLARPRIIAIESRGQVYDVELAPGEMRWFD